jgi:hypothetical protein
MCSLVLLQEAAAMRSSSLVDYHHDKAMPESMMAAPSTPIVPSVRATKKKRVHFSDVAFAVTIPRADPSEAHKLWWDDATVLQRRARDRVAVERNSVHWNPLYHESITFLMMSYHKEAQCRERLMERVRLVLDADVRGLEQRIVSQIKVNRHVAIKEILHMQRKLRQDGRVRPEAGSLLLRHKSLKLSRTARQLAFRLAQADQLDAV